MPLYGHMKHTLAALLVLLTLAGCGTAPRAPYVTPARFTEATFRNEPESSAAAREVGLYSLMLLQTGYEFGGKNPVAGFDCSGLVAYVYREAAGLALRGNAASLARDGREVPVDQMRTGDLVFFNTLGRPFSHVGIYLGRGEFVHAPNSRGRVRVEKLTIRYWSQHFEMARTLLD
ncbi:C40 family peptidase [Noviherbaspirillum sp. DKR-6]|uniref:C40 family peptidase n=2 Tax=Noviherbaspirillum pedocola TaxID=2801341 RepID=A0A934W9P2_9BURK|nr:C40 family peptidase [Noviherbaspirillum pedocola]